VGYGKDLRDDDSSTQDTSPHPLVSANVVRFKSNFYSIENVFTI